MDVEMARTDLAAVKAAQQAAQHWFTQPAVAPLGNGHIHETYRVDAPAGQYVLQKVNAAVFAHPEVLVQQTQRLLRQWRGQNRYLVPEIVPTRDGEYLKAVSGGQWRVWSYLADTRVIDPIETAQQAEQAGLAFGTFQAQLAGLPGPQFVDPIPGFLQLRHYLAVYDGVAHRAPEKLNRLIQQHRGLADQLSQANCTIHGDCKIDNLLFDQAGASVLAVIDFDTAMRGHWAWDFGDLARSVCFSLGRVDVTFFKACLQGFAAGQNACTVADSVAAPCYVALMLGVRFLTDHLQGDVYFRVRRPGQNLDRAEEQFDLFEKFCALRPQMYEAAVEVLA